MTASTQSLRRASTLPSAVSGRLVRSPRYFAALAALALVPYVFAANAAWNVDADGNWSDGLNWNPAAAPGAVSGTTSADIATFGALLSANRTVTVDANRNVGGITFNQSSSFSYTLSGGPLLLSNGGTVQNTNSSGTQTISITAPLVIQGDGGTFTFNGNGTSTSTKMVVGDISGASTSGNTTTLRLIGFNTNVNAVNSVTGVISDGAAGGKLAVNKGGSGTWILSGANTYSGGTTMITGVGALSIGGSSTPTSGTVTSGPIGVGPLVFGSGIVQAGAANATLANAISVPAGANTNVRATLSGNITLTGPVTGAGTFTNSHTSSNTVFVQGDISGFTGTFAHTTNTGGNHFTFNGAAAASQDGSNARFVLSGTGTNRGINIGNAAATTFKMGELSGAGGRIVPNVAGATLQVGALNTVPATPFSGAITGTLALEKVGTGTLTLAGANTHSGATTVSAGTLRVAGTGSLTLSPVTVASGGTIGGEGTLTQPLTFSDGASLAIDATTATGALNANGGVVVNGSVFLDLENAGALPGPGQTALALSYTGATPSADGFNLSRLRNASVSTATAGQINVTYDTKNLVWSGQSDAWTVGGPNNWSSGSDAFYQGDAVTFDDTGANKNVALVGNLTPASVTFDNNTGYDYALAGTGRLIGGASLTKNGTGTVTLSGGQAYAGATTVNGGTLVLAGANTLSGAVAVNATLQLRNSASLGSASALNLNNGGVLQLRSDADTTFGVPTLTLASGGNATIDVAPSTSGVNRTFTIGSLSFVGDGAVSSIVNATGSDGYGLTINSITVTNTATATTPTTRTRLFLRANTAPITVTGNITATSATNRDVGIVLDGSHAGSKLLSRLGNAGTGWTFVNKAGEGTWTLSGTGSNYSGPTTISAGGGNLRVETVSAISTTSAVNLDKTGVTTGTLQLNVPGSPTFVQAMNSLSSATFGAGGVAHVQNLQGNTTLSGNLTITGTGGSGMNIQSDAGGTLKLTGTLRNNVASSNRLFDLGGAGNGEVSGVVSDGANTGAVTSLMKEGSGTWTITGAANTYTGQTTVNGGTLAVTDSGTLGGGEFRLGNGATLDISAITAGSFTVPSGLSGSGLLNAAGKSVQIAGAYAPLAISITGNVALAPASTSAFTADTSGATRSTTVVTGSLQNDGALTISPAAGFVFAGGQSFDFVDATAGITAGYDSVTVGASALSQTTPGVWQGADGALNFTYTESTGVLSVEGASISAIQAWRNLHFPTAGNDGTGIGAHDADPDGDGISNLLEYATNSNPVSANATSVAVSNLGGRLALNFVRISDPSLTYTVQGGNDLVTWSTVTPFSGTNPTTGFVGGNSSVTETQNVQVVDSVLVSAQPRRFLRLQVSITP